MKPTGKKLSFTGVNINKVVNGKIVEHSEHDGKLKCVLIGFQYSQKCGFDSLEEFPPDFGGR